MQDNDSFDAKQTINVYGLANIGCHMEHVTFQTMVQAPEKERREQPLTKTDEDIKEALEELMVEKDENDECIFRNKKQWWAVFRVLVRYCNYPKQMTAFVSKVKELGVDNVVPSRAISYDSICKVANEVPKMSCDPSAWDTLKDINENYRQQYAVAEFLMLKIGIKS